MIRYFFINGVPHESKNGEWIKWETAEALITVIEGLTEANAKGQEEILYLENKFQEHRTGKITCEETCFCRQVDQWLAMMEIEKEGGK